MVANDTKQAIASRLNSLFLQKGYEAKHGRNTAIARDHKVSRETVRKWLDAEAVPELWRLVELCDGTEWTPLSILMGEDADRVQPNRAAQAKAASVIASPRTQRLLAKLAQAEVDGSLTDKDIDWLEDTLDRVLQR